MVSDSQEGFRKHKSCSRRAAAQLQLAIEEAHATGTDIYILYVDFKGAYPSVSHQQLLEKLRLLGLPGDFLRVVEHLYDGASTSFATLNPPPWMLTVARSRGTRCLRYCSTL